jgi:diguanylate cyclase (GGDEF)-like protein
MYQGRTFLFEGEELKAHLESCIDCRHEEEGMRRLDALLLAAYKPEREAAEVLVDKVKASLQARGRHVKRCTVLVVDDNADTLNVTRRLLQQADEFDVEIASSAHKAQEVAIIDVDRFKEINTKFDLSGGDQVLRDLARCMSAGVRKIDVLGRFASGDEFMLIAPHTHRPGAMALAERLRTLVQNHPFSCKGQRIPVTVTIGLAVVEAGRAAD